MAVWPWSLEASCSIAYSFCAAVLKLLSYTCIPTTPAILALAKRLCQLHWCSLYGLCAMALACAAMVLSCCLGSYQGHGAITVLAQRNYALSGCCHGALLSARLFSWDGGASGLEVFLRRSKKRI